MVQTSQALKTAFPNCEVKSKPAKKSGAFDVKITTPEGKNIQVFSKYGGDGQISNDKVQAMLKKIKDVL
jgi:hypothetical protein